MVINMIGESLQWFESMDMLTLKLGLETWAWRPYFVAVISETKRTVITFNMQSWSVHTNNAWVGWPPRTINHLCGYIWFWGLAIYNVNNRNKTELKENLEYLQMQIEISDDFFVLFLILFKLMWLLNFSINSLYYRSYRDNQIIKIAGRKKKAITYGWKCYFWGISRKSIIINKIWPLCIE